MNIAESLQEKVSKGLRSTTKEADRLILEYMQKKNLTIDDLKENAVMQQMPSDPWDECVTLKRAYWYKDELILSIKQRIDVKQPLATWVEMVIEKGDW